MANAQQANKMQTHAMVEPEQRRIAGLADLPRVVHARTVLMLRLIVQLVMARTLNAQREAPINFLLAGFW